MSVKNIIKSEIYEKFAGGSDLKITEVCLILLAALLIGCYIFMIYKMYSRSEFYSKDMNITLAGMTVVVAAIMVAMQSNLIVSLGMVGALSIVRFRTAVKSPLDLLYLFWAISAGIICGVGLYLLAIVLCIVMTFLILLLDKVPVSKAPAVLVVRTSMETDMNEVRDV
ncbi:MAG: DUF4956 domain-containing protein, partial [Lachnospiraceae bacterium]|nr:DUF4956 domain-containing protein [Lachnospiraceae bacterium]